MIQVCVALTSSSPLSFGFQPAPAMEFAEPRWEFFEHGGWKPMSPQINAALLNFKGEAVAILIEFSSKERRVYDIDTQMQHRQYHCSESNEWITVATKPIRLIYVVSPTATQPMPLEENDPVAMALKSMKVSLRGSIRRPLDTITSMAILHKIDSDF